MASSAGQAKAPQNARTRRSSSSRSRPTSGSSMASIPEEPSTDTNPASVHTTAPSHGHAMASKDMNWEPVGSNVPANGTTRAAVDLEAQTKKDIRPLHFRLLRYIVERGRVFQWYWVFGAIAIVLYTVQLVAPAIITYQQQNDPGYLQKAPLWLQLASAHFYKNLAYSVVIVGTVVTALLEQAVNKIIRERNCSPSEFITLAFVSACFVAGWILWGFREHGSFYEILSSYLFDLNEVVLMLRFAYRCLVANWECLPLRISGVYELTTHPDLPVYRPGHATPDSEHASRQRDVDFPEPGSSQRDSPSRASASTDTTTFFAKQFDITT